MGTHNIAVRYCGGCNPRFDRAACVRAWQKRFPKLKLLNFDPAETYGAVLVVCGCPAQCAGQADLPPDLPRFVLASSGDESRAAAFFEEIDKEC